MPFFGPCLALTRRSDCLIRLSLVGTWAKWHHGIVASNTLCLTNLLFLRSVILIFLPFLPLFLYLP